MTKDDAINRTAAIQAARENVAHGQLEFLIEALEELPTALPDAGWRDIESAPKDGTNFLIAKYGQEPVYIGSFRRPVFEGVQDQPCLCYLSYTDTRAKNYFRSGAMIKCGLNPTHWMPLPPPPEKAQAEDYDESAIYQPKTVATYPRQQPPEKA